MSLNHNFQKNIISLSAIKKNLEKIIQFNFLICIYIDGYYQRKKLSLDYNDLFTKTKYKYFFNIIFEKNIIRKTELGNIFLKKYLINFNLDSKMIEIYDEYSNDDIEGNNKNENDTKKNPDRNNNKLYLVITITGILGYFLGKYLNKIRKKRAIELIDDEYEYNPESKYQLNFR